MNNLFNEDCLEVLARLEDKSISLILQDPPYNITDCAWDKNIFLRIEEYWKEWKRVLTPNGCIIMTAAQPFTSNLILSNLKMFKYELIWEKEKGVNFITAKKKPMIAHENILIFYNKQPIYNPQMVDGKPYMKIQKTCTAGETHSWVPNPTNKSSDGKRYPKSILKFARDGGRDKTKSHPTQKPVALFEWLIKTYTNEGNIVFDGFMGSGTTGVACKNLNREFIGCEIEEKYFNMAKDRINL